MVHEGSLIRANDTTPLVVVNQLSPINVTFAVPSTTTQCSARFECFW